MPERPPSPHPAPDDLYADPPPWDIGRPQSAFRTLADAGAIRGSVLDVGCGTGEHTLMAAALGLDATGVDLAVTALSTAEQKAHDRGLKVRFLCHDALRLADLGESFDTVLDCGLFHSFQPADRPSFAQTLRAVVRPGGRYLMLAVSAEESDTWGPHRLTREEITATFAEAWQIDSIEASAIEVTTQPTGIRAWLASVTRV